MDKSELKVRLAACRPQDASDPFFAEALQAAAADPGLAAWLAEQQRFDAILTGKFAEVTVPAGLKDRILQDPRRATPAPPRHSRRWLGLGAVAAVLLVGLVAWPFLTPRPAPTARLAQQAINFTGQMPALQFVCFDPSAVAQWINEQPGTQKVGFTMPAQEASMSMSLIGSSVVEWNGHPVVMVCLQHGGRMAMLYILGAEAGGDLPDGTSETVQRENWVVRTTKQHGQVRLLTAKGRPEDLNFPMPF